MCLVIEFLSELLNVQAVSLSRRCLPRIFPNFHYACDWAHTLVPTWWKTPSGTRVCEYKGCLLVSAIEPSFLCCGAILHSCIRCFLITESSNFPAINSTTTDGSSPGHIQITLRLEICIVCQKRLRFVSWYLGHICYFPVGPLRAHIHFVQATRPEVSHHCLKWTTSVCYLGEEKSNRSYTACCHSVEAKNGQMQFTSAGAGPLLYVCEVANPECKIRRTQNKKPQTFRRRTEAFYDLSLFLVSCVLLNRPASVHAHFFPKTFFPPCLPHRLINHKCV